MDYPSFIARLANTAVYDPVNDPDFAIMAPQALEYGELRCLRDLDPIIARARRTPTALAGSEEVALDPDVVFPRAVWIDVGAGSWQRLERRDFEFLDMYGLGGGASVPRYWATRDGASVLLGPAWVSGGPMRIDVTARPTAMSPGNPTTWLGTWVPDLLFAAAMIFAVGFQRNFGEAQAVGSDGISWEKVYASALASAAVEERRRKADGPWDNSRTPPVSSSAPPG